MPARVFASLAFPVFQGHVLLEILNGTELISAFVTFQLGTPIMSSLVSTKKRELVIYHMIIVLSIPKLMGILKLGKLWVFVLPIHRPTRTKNQQYKYPNIA